MTRSKATVCEVIAVCIIGGLIDVSERIHVFALLMYKFADIIIHCEPFLEFIAIVDCVVS